MEEQEDAAPRETQRPAVYCDVHNENDGNEPRMTELKSEREAQPPLLVSVLPVNSISRDGLPPPRRAVPSARLVNTPLPLQSAQEAAPAAGLERYKGFAAGREATYGGASSFIYKR